MSTRTIEIVFLAFIAIAILATGPILLANLAQFHGLAISVLGVVGIVLVYAFRRNFLAGGPQARINATRDGAFLAAILSAICYIALAKARWAFGATIFAVESAIVIELLARFAPARP